MDDTMLREIKVDRIIHRHFPNMEAENYTSFYAFVEDLLVYYDIENQYSFDAGYDAGYTDGECYGREEGYEEGYAIGHEEGFEVGHTIGYEEGFETIVWPVTE